MELFGAIKLICLFVVLLAMGSNALKGMGESVSRHLVICSVDTIFLILNFFQHASVPQVRSVNPMLVDLRQEREVSACHDSSRVSEQAQLHKTWI